MTVLTADKREQIDRAITEAMSWHPSENGPSHAEKRKEVRGLIDAALSAGKRGKP